MIHFLRKSRQILLQSSKFRKYTLYAIGEILLVVIGILIALQVNNWNSDRLDRIKEREILLELKEGLKEDAFKLDSALTLYGNHLRHMHRLDSLLKFRDYPYSTDLDELFGSIYGIRYVRLNEAYFEELKNNGIHLIHDPHLKKYVVNLFEDTYELLSNYLDTERSTNQITRPYYLQNFVNIDFCRTATPIDYEKIWADPYYKNIVHYRIITLELNQMNWYKRAIQMIAQIVEKIDFYLGKDPNENENHLSN